MQFRVSWRDFTKEWVVEIYFVGVYEGTQTFKDELEMLNYIEEHKLD